MEALEKIKSKKEKYTKIYHAMQGLTDEQASQQFDVDFFAFGKRIGDGKNLSKCTALSIEHTFFMVIKSGMTFDETANHIYILNRGNKMYFQEQAHGTIFLCRRAGSIKDCSVPIIVYEGDEFKPRTENGVTVISHAPQIPRSSKNILAGFCFVTNPDGSKTPFYMLIEDVERLKAASAKQRKGPANSLYTSGEGGQIDKGFFQTKIVNAALKYTPKYDEFNTTHFEELENEFTERELAESLSDNQCSADPQSDMLQNEPISKQQVPGAF